MTKKDKELYAMCIVYTLLVIAFLFTLPYWL